MAKRKTKTIWYHGGRSSQIRDEPRWDRDRTTSSLNEEGPGIYFTSSYQQATSYGPIVLEMELPSNFKVMPMRKPTMKQLMALYEEASEEDQEIFLSNWGENITPQEALKHYSHQDNLHNAAVTLYGDLFRYDSDAYIEAIRTLGYDGVIVPKSYGVKHLIVWNPKKLRGHIQEAAYREENPGTDPTTDLIRKLKF